MVREINKQIKKEEKNFFFFTTNYVKAMRIIEKLVKKKEILKEKLTQHGYYYFCKKYEKFLCENGGCSYLAGLYRDFL